jgi:hypothetical protein
MPQLVVNMNDKTLNKASGKLKVKSFKKRQRTIHSSSDCLNKNVYTKCSRYV